jgi:hypothetical protein
MFIPAAIGLGLIYLRHNLGALAALDLKADSLVPVNGVFFLTIL